MVGPTASDGPALAAVTVTVPVVPGVIDGVVADTDTSALRAPAVMVVEALFGEALVLHPCRQLGVTR